MGLAPFFERVWGAVGGHLAVSRESLSAVLENVTVGIQIGKKPSENDQWISELCVNLCARLYPRLRIAGSSDLSAKLAKLALAINPNIEIVESRTDTFTIGIASTCGATAKAVYPSARGWVAQLGHAEPVAGGRSNPYAAGAAATLACAEMFRRIFTSSSQEPDLSVSLLNYDKTSGNNSGIQKGNAGNVLVVGVGAVGNAALWALVRDQDTTGSLTLVDPESVTQLNLQRYVLATQVDVDKPKVELAQRALAATNWKTSLQPVALEHLSLDLQRDVPTTMISVDNVEGRRSAQALLPQLIINGWTGGDALGASWHIFDQDSACLACLYHPRGKGLSAVEQAAKALGLSHDRTALLWVTHQPLLESDIHSAAMALGVKESKLSRWKGKTLSELYTDVVCGAAPIDIRGIGNLEMVPLAHQSALAGIMMSAELVKRSSSKLRALGQPEALVSWDNVLQSAPEIWRKPRAREPGCICGDQDYQTAYRAKWRKSRHQSRR